MFPILGQRPDYERMQEEQDFQQHQSNLKQMLKDNFDTNYNELVPSDPTDYNIAKANNAYDRLIHESNFMYGKVTICKTIDDVLAKIRTEGEVINGSSIHNRYTYYELAVMKFFGRNYSGAQSAAYNGITLNGPYGNSDRNNLEITHSITPGTTHIGNYLEVRMTFYKSSIKHELKELNNKTWVI
jgi:hypothetical protein